MRYQTYTSRALRNHNCSKLRVQPSHAYETVPSPSPFFNYKAGQSLAQTFTTALHRHSSSPLVALWSPLQLLNLWSFFSFFFFFWSLQAASIWFSSRGQTPDQKEKREKERERQRRRKKSFCSEKGSLRSGKRAPRHCVAASLLCQISVAF